MQDSKPAVFYRHAAHLSDTGHRVVALEDGRLLPLSKIGAGFPA